MFSCMAYIVELYRLHLYVVKRNNAVKFINSLNNQKFPQYKWSLTDSFAKKKLGKLDFKEYIKSHALNTVPSSSKLDIYNLHKYCDKVNDIYFCN